jgi:hypothetical protein
VRKGEPGKIAQKGEVMQFSKTLASRRRILLTMIAIGLLTVFTNVSVDAQYPHFFVCIDNQTSMTVRYSTEWCTRAGYNCTGYRLWNIAPGHRLIHEGPRGDGRMDVTIHSGGSGGTWLNYTFYGSEGGCDASSSYAIVINERGYIRIVSRY